MPTNAVYHTKTRGPQGPKKEQTGKDRQGGFKRSPFSATSERLPLKGKTLRRTRARNSVLNTAVNNDKGAHRDFRNQRLRTLSFGSIMNAFKMVPKGKEPTSPSLEVTPLFKNGLMKLLGGNKAVRGTRRPRGPRVNAKRGVSTQVLKMRTSKKKMRDVTDVTPAIQALRRITLLHLEKTISGAMTIGQETPRINRLG